MSKKVSKLMRNASRRGDDHFTAKTAAAKLVDYCRNEASEERKAAEGTADRLERIADTVGDVPSELMEEYGRALNRLGYWSHRVHRVLLDDFNPILNAQHFVQRFVEEARAGDAAANRARFKHFDAIGEP